MIRYYSTRDPHKNLVRFEEALAAGRTRPPAHSGSGPHTPAAAGAARGGL